MKQQTTPVLDPNFKVEDKTQSITYKHIFSNEEKLEIGAKLALQQSEKAQFELDKKSMASDFKSKIEAKDAEISMNTNYINSGYKFEPVEAIKRPNLSEMCFEIIHPDNGEVVEKVPFKHNDIRALFPNYYDFEHGNMVWYSPYSGLAVDSRPLTDSERQLNIVLDENNDENDKVF